MSTRTVLFNGTAGDTQPAPNVYWHSKIGGITRQAPPKIQEDFG